MEKVVVSKKQQKRVHSVKYVFHMRQLANSELRMDRQQQHGGQTITCAPNSSTSQGPHDRAP
jgi:hypothetical protein